MKEILLGLLIIIAPVATPAIHQSLSGALSPAAEVTGVDTSKDLICGRFSNEHGFLLCRPFDQTAKFFGIEIGEDGRPILAPTAHTVPADQLIAVGR